MKMNKVFEELKKTRLMVLARGVPKDVLLKAVAAIKEAGGPRIQLLHCPRVVFGRVPSQGDAHAGA